MAMELVGEYRIPCYALSYLSNADASGIEEEDVNEIESFLRREHLEGCSMEIVDGEHDEFDKHPAFGLACDTELVRFYRYVDTPITKKNLYDRVCHVLTDYEHNGEDETNFEKISAEDFNEIFYETLFEVQRYFNEESEE